jgi:hypothetical protein
MAEFESTRYELLDCFEVWKQLDYNIYWMILDADGLEDSDVRMEDEKLRKTNLKSLFESHNVVVRYELLITYHSW